jgi:tyrosinase
MPINDGGFLPFSQVTYGPASDAPTAFPMGPQTTTNPQSPNYLALGFAGRVELAPHDNVHDYIGGYMGFIPVAANDPIFYVHHCQIDRLWACWAAKPGATYNFGNDANSPSKQTWSTQQMTFVDENGNVVTKPSGEADKTTDLGYEYDSCPPPALIVAERSTERTLLASRRVNVTLAAMQVEGVTVGNKGARVILSPERPPSTGPGKKGLVRPGPAPVARATTLVLSGIKLISSPPAPLHVFLNLPEGVAPDLTGPYYVGVINLFKFAIGEGSHAEHGPASRGEITFYVADVLARQRALGTWNGGPISVTVTTLGAEGPPDKSFVTIGKVELRP